MKCQKNLDWVTFHFGEMSALERSECENHLIECRECLESFLGVKRGVELPSLLNAKPSEKARLALFREAESELQRATTTSTHKLWRPWLVPAFGLAGLALCVSIFSYLKGVLPSENPTEPATSTTAISVDVSPAEPESLNFI